MDERIGVVEHYWPRAGAASLRIEEDVVLRVGDRVRIRGHGHDVVQQVSSIEVDHRQTREARPDDDFAIAVERPVHAMDEVFLIRESSGPKE